MSNKKCVYLYLIILPIIDLITSLLTRLFPTPLSFGVIVKGLFLLCMIIYTLLKSTSKYKKITIIYSTIILLYMIAYILSKIKYLDFSSLVDELTYLFKIMYLPILLPNLVCYFDDKHFSKKEIIKILTINLVTYMILLLIPIITTLGFNSYDKEFRGLIGWFYSANEISIITIVLLPFILIKSNMNIKTIVIALISLITISFIDTKVSDYGIVIITSISLIINVIKKSNIKTIISSFILTMLAVILLITNYKINYLEENMNSINNPNIINKRADEVNYEEAVKTSQETKLLNEQYNKIKEEDKKIDDTKLDKISKKLLSSRDIYFKLTYKIYKKHFNILVLLFGIGYTNTVNISNFGIEKLIEIDPLDIFFHSGLIALIITLLPYIYYMIKVIKNKKFNADILFYSFILLFVLGVSCLSGHILMAPAVGIYLALYYILGFDSINQINKSNSNIIKNKVTIFALHLNYGGIEKNICDKANILSKIYDVEIISLYKLNKDPSFKLNEKVRVKYLTNNIKPNRNEFLDALKKKKIIKIIKEGFKSIKILYLKNKLVTDSMINCNSSIIISTRIDFTLKLIKNNEYENIKIAEEHIYHNNNTKYLNQLNYVLKYVDYLMPSSDYLTNYYKKLFVKNSYKIITNRMIIETDNSISNLSNKTIISVGRLNKVKAFDELIKLFAKINNREWKLIIVGDGEEYNNLNNLIKSLNMEDNIKLLGFKTQEELNELYRNSSIYVMTSIEESFGLVLVEAASHGLPLIAYSSALGAKEIIGDSNGILINNRNKSEMINELSEIMGNKTKLKEYQTKSLRLSIKYNKDNIVEENISFYKNIKKNNIFSNLYIGTKKECYQKIEKKLKNSEKTFVVTANPETYSLCTKDLTINKLLNDKNNLIVPDGISVVKTASYLGYNVKERITGIDLAEHLLSVANKNKYKVYLFGASKIVNEKLESIIKEKYKNIDLVGCTDGYIKNKDAVMKYIRLTDPDIVLVALGIPLQEKLIYNNLNDFDKGIFVGVGGSFDVLSGTKKRAPKVFIKCNLEWLYRILKEPKRIIRFIKYNIKFLIIVYKEKKYKNVDK